MAITTIAQVKLLGKLYDIIGNAIPTTATVGEVGDIYLDYSSDLSYVCTAVNAGPPVTYTWVVDISKDYEISLFIARAESDYLNIRGVAFDVDSLGATVYPSGADSTAAEMVCYLSGIGRYDGRGKKDESLSGRSASYDDKIHGYPRSIVGTIKRYQSAL